MDRTFRLLRLPIIKAPKRRLEKILLTIGDLDVIEVKAGEKNLRVDGAQVDFCSRFRTTGHWEGFSSRAKHFFSIWWAFTQLATRQQERPVGGGIDAVFWPEFVACGLLSRTPDVFPNVLKFC